MARLKPSIHRRAPLSVPHTPRHRTMAALMVQSMKLNRPLNRYLTSLLVASTALLVALPAQAAKLQTWGFDAGRSQLSFTTDEGVQPTAQLIVNPTRLVIDLPGVVFGRPQTSQPVNSAAIRSVRAGQFEKGTTRIVVELEPGYTLDPNQVKFKGLSPRQWTVTIPTPQREIGGAPIPPVTTIPGTPLPNPTPDSPIPDVANTQIQSVRVTGDGFFVRTSGQVPQIRLTRSPDRRRIDVDLLGASISPSVSPRDFIVNKAGVGRVIVSQIQGTPPIARVSLSVDLTTPDWQASYSDIGGVVLLPGTGAPIATPGPTPTGITTIQSVDLANGNQQLAIVGNQPLAYTAGWDRAGGYYKVTIQNAQLDKKLKGPQLPANSPLLQVRLRQETPQTVAILISPAAGVVVNSPISTGRQSIALPLTANRSLPPVVFPTDGTVIPVPPRIPGGLPGPRPPIGRAVVVIDPGHGGADPGAVGRGNLYEKEIVLDISRQVAGILAQNGVQAILTRNSDEEIELQPRVDTAERANATLFVSIHANSISLDRPDVNGLETYYFDSGLGLANAIHASVLRTASIEDRRVRKARFYVIRKTSMPSVLVETGFVTGATDAANLATAAHRQNMARGIAQGILQYLRGG
jgi:N-acetylmuramoyl-L-alanine amidase